MMMMMMMKMMVVVCCEQVNGHSGARGKVVSGGSRALMNFDVTSGNTPATSRSLVAPAVARSHAQTTSLCIYDVTITSPTHDCRNHPHVAIRLIYARQPIH